MMDSKSRLYQFLQEMLSANLLESEGASAMAKESRDSETKSTVGDKYETGRAMAQIEIQKLEGQVAKIQQMQRELTMVDLSMEYKTASFGAWVETSQGNYFLSIGIGKVVLEGETAFVISMASPIGKLLQGKQVGDVVVFQGNEIRIVSIT